MSHSNSSLSTNKLLPAVAAAAIAALSFAGWSSKASAAFITENLNSAGVANVGSELTNLAPGSYILGGVNFDLSGGNYTAPYGLSGGSGAVTTVAGTWSGHEAQNLNSDAQESMTLTPNQYGVTSVYTLINMDWGTTDQYLPGTTTPYAEIIFTASGGVSDTVDLVGGNQIRDWNNDGYVNTTSSAYTTDGVFTQATDALGQAGRVDMQQFVLPTAFATQTLQSIEFVDNGSNNVQRIVVTGVSLETAATPEPTAALLLAPGAAGLVLLRRRGGRA